MSKEKETTALDIVLKLIHLPKSKMAKAIAAINRGNEDKPNDALKAFIDSFDAEAIKKKLKKAPIVVDIDKFHKNNEEAAARQLAKAPPMPEENMDILYPADPVKIERPIYTERGATICSHCGSDYMRRNGTCWVCMDCAETTGCS